MRIVCIVLALTLLGGCIAMPDAPKTTLEQIELAELSAQQAGASITSLTCTRFEKKICIEAGKAFYPDEAKKHHDKVQEVRKGLAVALALGGGGVGECLGQSRTQIACLSAARSLLAQVEQSVIDAKRKGVK